jgi:two-component system, OmpR family, sensor histidine kinase KdpD
MNSPRKSNALFKRIGLVLASIAAICCTTILTLKFHTLASAPTAAFCFLIIVLLASYFGDLMVAIIVSIIATLCFDYFYLPPFGTFNISAFSDWIALIAFLLTSVIISDLTASAAENKANAKALSKALVQVKEFGEKLLSVPYDQHTLSGIAKLALDIFTMEYCSIHVYGEGKWQHYTGAAASESSQEIENRLKAIQDHPTDIMELADEEILGVKYRQIHTGTNELALLAVKSKTIPGEVLSAIAYMIGVLLHTIMKNKKA